MDSIEVLKEEHEKIEQFLLELETIMESEEMNYPNLIHTFQEFHKFWDKHEKKEEKTFKILEKAGFKIPISKIVFDHGELKKERDYILNAIDSGSEFKVREALEKHGKKIIEKIRIHKKYEDEMIYTLPIESLGEEIIRSLDLKIKEYISS